MTRRRRRKQQPPRDDWRPPDNLRLKPFDLGKYLGRAGAAKPPYTEAQLAVMLAGSAGLYLAIREIRPARMQAEARRSTEENRARFHKKPHR